MQSTNYNPSYITNRKPQFYGGKQEEYVKLANEAIDSGLNTIVEEMSNKTDPVLIYHKVMKVLQNARNKIALQHQPELSGDFGIRRDDPSDPEGFKNAYTPLYGSQYQEYNAKFMDRLISVLNKIPHDLKAFQQHYTKVEETVSDMKYAFEVELLETKDINERGFTITPTSKELCQALKIKDKPFEDIVRDNALMKQLKASHKSIYDRFVMTGMMNQISLNFPSPKNPEIDVKKFVRHEYKNIYIVGTMRLELEKNQMFCISKRFTWLYQDWVQDPVERMRNHSNAYIIHQDPFLLERTEKACAKIFADAINWNKNTSSLDDLKEKVALLRFVYGNVMPCLRGDGAVGDWLELDIYRYHGFNDTKHNTDVLPCFELLTTTHLTDYMEAYKKTITVQ